MALLKLDENQVRVVAPDVGGGFGAKFVMYPEEVAVAAGGLRLRRPVKWVEDRREHFLAAVQEREQYWDLEAAFEADGKLRGMRGRMIHDEGAYTPQGINLPYNASTAVPGPYLLPAYDLQVQVVETNKVATMPVRGAGYPEGAFAMERVLDAIARELDLDRAEVRRRNLVPADRIPYVTPLKTRSGSAITLDSGDFPQCQQLALDAIGYGDFSARQAQGAPRRALSRHRHRQRHQGHRARAVRIRHRADRPLRPHLGLYRCDADGAGYQDRVGADLRRAVQRRARDVTVMAGDTAVIPHGQGGFASRQTITAGSAVHMAAVAVREKALTVAAHLLEASPQDLELENGEIAVAGTDRRITLKAVAEAVSGVPGYNMPGNFEPGLESLQNFIPPALTYGLGCHAVEVEVDIETCGVRILRYVVVNDSGRLVNPMIVEGQIVGGVAHAIGNSLLEWMGYDDGGQPLTTNFADYLLAGLDRRAKDRRDDGRIPVAAQSARRQGCRRIRLRAGRRRNRLGDRACARTVRRADRRISGDAGAALSAARGEILTLRFARARNSG